ncbi:anti-sigma factor [Streptomyces flavofungini]|uniref:anti-sigma factor n=1 Tax=Streptomyces flavofungini TaxID=68200 RepID=UPI0025B029C1|nr:anti-sigma factor [Streptomyces flavofungini]WJV44118.1 anti-sigma factor [Streptomyces flavofungini]
MRHLDHAELAEIALGEMDDGQSPRSLHLDRCATCRTELEELRRVVVAARSLSADDVLAPPPDRVWEAISAELGLAPGSGGRNDEEADARSADGTDPAVDARERRSRLAEVSASAIAGARGSEATGARPARRTRFAVLLAAACLAAGAALGSGATWWQLRDDDAAAAPTGVGSPLKPMADGDAQGVARLDTADGARRQLRIDVSGLPGTDGYFEVWLMDPTHKKLIAIGVLGPRGSATLPLPKGVDLADYPLVDVSDQEYNGDPTHSGNSVVRGLLKR